MTEGHLKYFKVKNFKRFDELELKDLGQFNLITGDNNVGKTSLLEALLIDEDWKQTLWNYHRTLNIRGLAINLKSEAEPTGEIKLIFPKVNYLPLLTNIYSSLYVYAKMVVKKESGSEHSDLEFNLQYKHRPRFLNNGYTNLPVNAEHLIYGHSQGVYDSWLHIEEYALGSTDIYADGFPFIPVFRGYTNDVVKQFSEIKLSGNNALAYIIDSMRLLVPDIQHSEIIELEGIYQVFLHLKGQDKPVMLTQFGDGAVRFFSILNHIIRNKGGRLMIDEVESGIHHSRMEGFLKNLIKMAVANNVQLFMTTHSLECQQAFAEVFEDPEMVHLKSEFRNITLVEAQDHSVKPFIYNHEQLAENLELGIETRGRKLA